MVEPKDRIDGRLRVTRVMPSVLPNEPWNCADCGRGLSARDPLSRQLSELSEAAVEASGRGGFVA